MIRLKNVPRYAILTVDTEALPKRAAHNHVNHLIWGAFSNGSAGIREICSIGDEFRAKHVFFVDCCGAFDYLEEMCAVIRWLDQIGQDVQLHAHPEVLPQTFWAGYGLSPYPAVMNYYTEDARAECVIKHFGKLISEVTGKEILAFRAGSFRWNATTIRALKLANVHLSFNNSMRAYRAGHCPFSEPTNQPYLWSNGVLEVPVTERCVMAHAGAGERWVSLTYPESNYFRFGSSQMPWFADIFCSKPLLTVFLLHSWSMLYWDENGHATYRDDQRLEAYRKLLARLTKDYDVITTKEFLDLHASGKIPITKTVNLDLAEFKQ